MDHSDFSPCQTYCVSYPAQPPLYCAQNCLSTAPNPQKLAQPKLLPYRSLFPSHMGRSLLWNPTERLKLYSCAVYVKMKVKQTGMRYG